MSTSSTNHSATHTQVAIEQEPQMPVSETNDPSNKSGVSKRRRLGARWWAVAGGSALFLILLTAATIYLLTKSSSTVDNIIITTVPSGAEIKLNSNVYGLSPVKLEQLAKGTYTLTITKENFQPIVKQVTLSNSQDQFEFKLTPLPPSDLEGLPLEDKIKAYQDKLEEALALGHYGIPYNGSAHQYASFILMSNPNDEYALKRLEDIRAIAQKVGKEAIARGDLAQAQEINRFIRDYYDQKDEFTRRAVSELEGQLYSQSERLNDSLRKAREALGANNLAGAFSYMKQALDVDRQNAEARRIRDGIREGYVTSIKQAFLNGNIDEASRQRDQFSRLFPEEKELRTQLRDAETAARVQLAEITDPSIRREKGLTKYRNREYADAIRDLEYAMMGGRSEAEVIFALARSHQMIGQLDEAASYFNRMQPSTDDSYRSSIAALGDIAMQRGDTATAVEKYKKARQLGGSALYPISSLDDKIERIEKRQREKAAEPVPFTMQARHQHGSLRGSCNGTITVNSTGVRYDGSEHQFSWNLLGVSVRIKPDELTIFVQGKSEKFKVDRSTAERFRETLARYQQTNTPGNQ